MKTLILFLSLLIIIPVSQAKSTNQHMGEDVQHINRWNHFFNSLLELHKQYISSHDIEKKESLGGYVNQPNFYREVSYYDKKSQRLLSKIQWEQKNPQQAHLVEIYIYDDQGRVDRDYLAVYLPGSRNAPIQTLINLHQYADDLHSYRQFDASGNRIYEHCERGKKNHNILIALEDDDIAMARRGLDNGVDKKIYQQCFEGIEETAINYLQPF